MKEYCGLHTRRMVKSITTKMQRTHPVKLLSEPLPLSPLFICKGLYRNAYNHTHEEKIKCGAVNQITTNILEEKTKDTDVTHAVQPASGQMKAVFQAISSSKTNFSKSHTKQLFLLKLFFS